MPLDTPPDDAPAYGRVREDEDSMPHTPRPPGVVALRIVIVIFLISAAIHGWNVLANLAAGSIDLVSVIMLALEFVAGFGLLLRVEAGRIAGITALYIWLLMLFLGVFLWLLGVLRGLTDQADSPEVSATATLFGITIIFALIALRIWMLTILHSKKTIALMERNVSIVNRSKNAD